MLVRVDGSGPEPHLRTGVAGRRDARHVRRAAGSLAVPVLRIQLFAFAKATGGQVAFLITGAVLELASASAPQGYAQGSAQSCGLFRP